MRTSRWLIILGTSTALVSSPFTAASAGSTPTCFGRPATIIGTSGDDVIMGNDVSLDFYDVIVGLGGNDRIDGGPGGSFDGADLICGGGGDDSLVGSSGDDRISGGPGNDWILGDTGADDDSGSDRLYGNGGDDHLDGQGYSDKLYGGAGRDVLVDIWGRAPDELYGEEGEDRLQATNGSPTIVNGGRDRDICVADLGDTIVSCEGSSKANSTGWDLESRE